MKPLLPFLALTITATFAFAGIPASDYTRAVFSDDFSGTDFGKQWKH